MVEGKVHLAAAHSDMDNAAIPMSLGRKEWICPSSSSLHASPADTSAPSFPSDDRISHRDARDQTVSERP